MLYFLIYKYTLNKILHKVFTILMNIILLLLLLVTINNNNNKKENQILHLFDLNREIPISIKTIKPIQIYKNKKIKLNFIIKTNITIESRELYHSFISTLNTFIDFNKGVIVCKTINGSPLTGSNFNCFEINIFEDDIKNLLKYIKETIENNPIHTIYPIILESILCFRVIIY